MDQPLKHVAVFLPPSVFGRKSGISIFLGKPRQVSSALCYVCAVPLPPAAWPCVGRAVPSTAAGVPDLRTCVHPSDFTAKFPREPRRQVRAWDLGVCMGFICVHSGRMGACSPRGSGLSPWRRIFHEYHECSVGLRAAQRGNVVPSGEGGGGRARVPSRTLRRGSEITRPFFSFQLLPLEDLALTR